MPASIPRERLIVGVDYGTTFSGVSYVTTAQRDVKDITVIRRWPGDTDARKTPTRIAYKEDNPRLEGIKWGFQADAKVMSCAWTKLLLDRGSDSQEHDDPVLRQAAGSGIFHLPEHRDAEGVCEDFLREVYQHVTQHIEMKIGQGLFDVTPMDCWLTIPATWSDRAKASTKDAAKRAGFGGRKALGDRLSTIMEPEAAALAALKGYEAGESINPIKAGEHVLVCDCGGGTVDITTYVVFTTTPLQFEELCAKCGSTFIDRNLHKLMSEKFGAAFDKVPAAKKGPGSIFMKDFEILKSDFRDSAPDHVVELTLKMDLEESESYDPDDGTIKLTRRELRGLIDPVVLKVLQLVRSQAQEVQKIGQGKIDRIVLVGGFGDSIYLFERLKEWSRRELGAIIVCPEHPQSAVVLGAALRGLEGLAPRKRKCRRHYGVAVGMPFRPDKDPVQFRYQDAATKMDYCSGRAEWLLKKGAEITKDTKKIINIDIHVKQGQEKIAELELFSCNLATPPDRVDHERVTYVGKIRVDLTSYLDSDSSGRKDLKIGGKGSYSIAAEVQVEFGNESGILQFKTVIDGKEAGKTSIDFD
ncbi:related to hsp70 protein [Phialocephala subalpina]|uniref:Related to hsp70 protein n=1 Tax=Phialocephala subalpina TaxID=576137 RepID=A0A1L7XPE7_9HELO|nr:related to hsp70 protein [Phialocephala subalpina]